MEIVSPCVLFKVPGFSMIRFSLHCILLSSSPVPCYSVCVCVDEGLTSAFLPAFGKRPSYDLLESLLHLNQQLV